MTACFCCLFVVVSNCRAGFVFPVCLPSACRVLWSIWSSVISSRISVASLLSDHLSSQHLDAGWAVRVVSSAPTTRGQRSASWTHSGTKSHRWLFRVINVWPRSGFLSRTSTKGTDPPVLLFCLFFIVRNKFTFTWSQLLSSDQSKAKSNHRPLQTLDSSPAHWWAWAHH